MNHFLHPGPIKPGESRSIFVKQPPSQILERFDYLLGNRSFISARNIIDSLDGKKFPNWPDLLNARIELKKKNYNEAIDYFSAVKKKGGREIIGSQMGQILNDIEDIFRDGSAPEPLIYLSARVLSIDQESRAAMWLDHNHYWVRWNAVKVFESAGKEVDMVKIHILDLQTARSFRTRIKAAEKLGELGDPRAIPALEQARDRGFRDPFVANTAEEILERYFSGGKASEE